MSVTSMYSDGLFTDIVILKDKFDSYVCHLDKIRITVNANDFYNIIKNNSDTQIFTIEEYHDRCEDLSVPQFMMFSEENDNEIYSSLVFKTFDDSKYIFESYKVSNIFKIKSSILNKIINEMNNRSDFMNIHCFENKLIFKSEVKRRKSDVQVIKSNINFDYSVCIKDFVCCTDLEYDSVFLIIEDKIFQTAYWIKSLGMFYLNNWRVSGK